MHAAGQPAGLQARSMETATVTWMRKPDQMERVFSDSVPSTVPARIAARASAQGFPKWIMQYGTTIAMMTGAPMACRAEKSRNPRKKNSSVRNCVA